MTIYDQNFTAGGVGALRRRPNNFELEVNWTPTKNCARNRKEHVLWHIFKAKLFNHFFSFVVMAVGKHKNIAFAQIVCQTQINHQTHSSTVTFKCSLQIVRRNAWDWTAYFHKHLRQPYYMPCSFQGRAKPDFKTRNRNQCAPVCRFQLRNRNQHVKMLVFDTEIEINILIVKSSKSK